jgi:predicted PurR-regulated permease PerM
LQTIEGNTLVPLVMMGAVNLNPLAVNVALLFGTELLGVVGRVLAVPAVAILQVLVMRVLAPRARHAAGSDGPTAAPRMSPPATDDHGQST